MSNEAKTPDQIRLEFYRNGKTFQQWAIDNGYHPVLVSKVLNGAVKANRGKGLEVAVKLGLKAA
ncbi:DNA-binding protein [Avibacterium endocarditidis]|uniref:DNA-binding protein n=1 Tax=Avibacterium endocarditidis TaxID=380674 RepID=UPI0039FC0D57